MFKVLSRNEPNLGECCNGEVLFSILTNTYDYYSRPHWMVTFGSQFT